MLSQPASANTSGLSPLAEQPAMTTKITETDKISQIPFFFKLLIGPSSYYIAFSFFFFIL
jgi:hypothetical protein